MGYVGLSCFGGDVAGVAGGGGGGGGEGSGYRFRRVVLREFRIEVCEGREGGSLGWNGSGELFAKPVWSLAG